MQDPSDKEIEKDISLCIRMVMRNLGTLKKKGISALAYSKVSMEVALYTLRCAAENDEEFKEAVMPVLELSIDKVNKEYGREADIDKRQAN